MSAMEHLHQLCEMPDRWRMDGSVIATIKNVELVDRAPGNSAAEVRQRSSAWTKYGKEAGRYAADVVMVRSAR